MSVRYLSLSLLFFSVTLALSSQSPSPTELFKPIVLTPENSSTIGVEGPGVDKNGVVYYVNYKHEGSIGQITPEGEASIFVELPEGSVGNGIRFDSHGNMMIADYTKHNILKVNMSNRKISVYAHESGMSQPNDIAIDSKNRLYASDPDWKNRKGKIWRIDTKGKVTMLDSLGLTNGIEVSPDENILYVNAGRKVWAYDLSPEGEVSNRHLLIEFPDFGMDGMRCDINGNLYITRYGVGAVVIVSPEGKVIRKVALTGKSPTNVAFGGKDGCTVYVTLQDQRNLECFRTDTPGREWMMQRKIKR
ncbi:MAG TPA: SMP-30/gluconolactonase/LRE family protein [Bacteroidales bacterium]|nr:SMP-30/gluconolactonase/LRE family protein [Bacteroidales bacterium]